jgi:hypothetical protein
MIQYKDHVIAPTVTHFPAAGGVPHIAYSILKDGVLVRNGIVYGPFNTLNEAFLAAEAAARGWIDQHGK